MIKHKNLPMGEVWDCSDCFIGHSPGFVENWLRGNVEYLASLAEDSEA